MQGLIVEKQKNKIRINSRTWIIEKKDKIKDKDKIGTEGGNNNGNSHGNTQFSPLVESQAIAVKDKEKKKNNGQTEKNNIYLVGRTEVLSLDLERIYRNVVKYTEKLKEENKLKTPLTGNEPILMKDTLSLLYYMGRKAVLKKFLSWKLKKQVKYLSNPYLFYLNKHLDFHSARVISMRTQTPMALILTAYAYTYHILEEAYKNGRESITENHLMFELADMLDIEEDKAKEEIEIMKTSKISGSMPVFDEGYVYLPWVYFLRKRVLDMFKGNEAVKVNLPDNNNDGQIQELLFHKYSILTGGPGTGKTTLLRKIAKTVDGCILAGMTGKAAQQLGEDARTIHSLLGYGPKGFQVKRLDCNVLVIDEASMINWRILYAVLKAADRVIFAGDPKQLPPIEGESVFTRMIEMLPTVQLKKVWRFVKGHNIWVMKKGSDGQIFNVLNGLMRKLKNKNFQIITPLHKGLLGTEYLNEYFQKVLNPNNDTIEGLKRGDRVIVNQNVYNEHKEMIAANGVTGVIYEMERTPDNIYCLVDTANNRVLLKREHLDLAYALTVHKFQGSECDYTVFILPDKEKIREDFVTDEMVLVGKTRGRIKTFVLEVG